MLSIQVTSNTFWLLPNSAAISILHFGECYGYSQVDPFFTSLSYARSWFAGQPHHVPETASSTVAVWWFPCRVKRLYTCSGGFSWQELIPQGSPKLWRHCSQCHVRVKLQSDGGFPLLGAEVCIGCHFIWEFKTEDEIEGLVFFTGTSVAELVLSITELATRISEDCI